MSEPTLPQTFGPDGKPVELPAEDVPHAYLSGKVGFAHDAEIPVLDPNGTPGTITAADAQSAFSQGYKLEPISSQQARYLKETYSTPGQQAIAGAEGLARGVTLGLSTPVETALGVDPEGIKHREEYNPYTAGVPELLGTAAPILLSGGTAAVAEGGAALAEKGLVRGALELSPAALLGKAGDAARAGATKLVGSEGTKTLAGKIAASAIPHMAGGVVEGAMFGAGNLIHENALGDTDLSGESILAHVGLGAAVGGVIGGSAGTLGAAGGAAKSAIAEKLGAANPGNEKILAKSLNVLFGLPEESTQAYLSRAERIRNAPELEEVQGQALEHVTKVMDDVEHSKIGVESAKQSFQDAKQNIVDGLREHGYSVKEAEREAHEALSQAYAEKMAALNSQSVTGLRDEVVSRIDQVQQQMFDKSAESREILSQSPADFSLKPFYNKVDELIQAAKDKPSSASARVVQGLEQYKNMVIDAYGNERVRGNAVKNILQGLDQDTKYVFGASVEDDALNAAKKQLRHSLDQRLKTEVPEYGEKMKQVFEDRKLIDELKGFDTESKAFSKLRNIDSEAGQELHMPALKKLEERTGGDFVKKLEAYTESQRALENKLDLKKNLPEYEKWEKAAKDLEELNRLKATGEGAKIQEALIRNTEEFKNLQESMSKQELAKSIREQLKGLTPGNVEKAVERAMSGKDPALLRKIEQIIPADQLADLRVKMSFEKGAQYGSRNVNLYASVAGALLGGEFSDDPVKGAIEGLGFGAGLGGIVDKYGPKIAQKILDGYMRLKNVEQINTTVQKAITSNVREFVKQKLSSESIGKVAQASSVGYLTRNKIASEKSDRSKLDRQQAFKKRFDEVAKLQASPQSLAENVGNNISSLHQVAPKTSAALTQAAVRGAQFLYDKAPKDPSGGNHWSPMLNKWKPSDAEIAKWERYVTAVDNPMSVLKDMKKGMMTREGVEALKVVYPKIYSSIVSNLTEHLADLREDLPYQKRLQLSVFFGVPIDASTDPKFISQMQQINGMSGQDQASGGGGGKPMPQAGKMTKSNSVMTETQRVLSRG